MTKVTIKLDPKWKDVLEADDTYRSVLAGIARSARARIAAFSPGRYGQTIRIGHRGYKASIESTDTGGRITLYSTSPWAHLVEWGSANNPPYAPMRRGVESLGLKVDPAPKGSG